MAVRPGGWLRRRKGRCEGQRESTSQNRHQVITKGGHPRGWYRRYRSRSSQRPFPPLSHLRNVLKSVFCPRLCMSRMLWQGKESIRHHPVEADPLFPVHPMQISFRGLYLKELRARSSTSQNFIYLSDYQRSRRFHRRALRSIQYDATEPVSTPPASTPDPGHIAPRPADAGAFWSSLESWIAQGRDST